MPALSVADLRPAGFHGADEVREVPAQIVREKPLGLDYRQKPLEVVTRPAGPSPRVADDVQDVLGRPERRGVAVAELSFSKVAVGRHELIVCFLETWLVEQPKSVPDDLGVHVLAVDADNL